GGTDLALLLEQKRDEIGLANLTIADRGVGGSRVVVGEDHCAPGVCAQAMQDWGEVRVARKYDEFVKVRAVREIVDDIHDHADVGGVLELGGERRTIDNLESSAQEMVAHERE